MTNKLSMQDIIDMLALQHDIPKEEAEKFIVELFNVIELGLSADELVKIKDFGTFRLIIIQERESVDINTQDKIVIPSHRRISFIPAQSLKSLVNKPFAHFETTPLNDGIVLENIEEDSSSDDDLSGEDDLIEENDKVLNKTEKVSPVILMDADASSHILNNHTQNLSNEGGDKEEKLDLLAVDAANNTSKAEEMELIITEAKSPIDSSITTKTKTKTKSKSKRSFLPWYIATAILMVLLVLVFYKFYPVKESPTKQGVQDSVIPKPIQEITTVVKDTISQETIEPVAEPIEIVKMERGKTLRLIALDKYGNREFWVYIYLKNKDKITNPDVVPVGLDLILPNKTEYDIDAEDPASVAKAKKTGDEEMKKFW